MQKVRKDTKKKENTQHKFVTQLSNPPSRPFLKAAELYICESCVLI